MNMKAAARRGSSDKGSDIFGYAAGKYYRTYLDDPVCLDYTDDNFCCMVGYSPEEIHDLFEDRYTELVHPDDRGIYEEFVRAMQSEECSLMTQYRLVSKSGDIIHVIDTMTSKISDKGDMQGFSVVTDLNDVCSEENFRHICDDITSCGMIRFTDEKYPSVISMNKGMETLLRTDDDRNGMKEDMQENIYMMLPFEYRTPFRRYLEQVGESDKRVNLKLDLFRCNGERVSVIGWIYRTVVNDRKEYQGVFFDASEYLEDERISLREDFVGAVRHVYDTVFEVNLVNETIKCLCTDEQDSDDVMPGVRMMVDDAIEYWSRKIYPAEDSARFCEFFGDIRSRYSEEMLPQTVEFGICRSDNVTSDGGGSYIRYYSGTYFRLNDATGMFCCCDITNRKANGDRMHGRSNILEFRKKGNLVKLMSVSEETRRFIGISRKELEFAETEGRNIDDLFANCSLSGKDIADIIEYGSMEYTVGSTDGRTIRRSARMIVSSADDDRDNPYYAILYNMISARRDSDSRSLTDGRAENEKIRVRTFGYFDVFVNGTPVLFKSAKAKELLAILVDRRGGYVSASEAISYLWENETANKVTLARYRKVAMRLKNELRENNISDLVITSEGNRCINQNIVQCDLYDYLEDKEHNKDLYRGSYLLNYSWGEFTQSELQGI